MNNLGEDFGGSVSKMYIHLIALRIVRDRRAIEGWCRHLSQRFKFKSVHRKCDFSADFFSSLASHLFFHADAEASEELSDGRAHMSILW